MLERIVGGHGRKSAFGLLGGDVPERNRRALRSSVMLGLVVGTPLSALLLALSARGVDIAAVADALLDASPAWLAGVLAAFAGTYLSFAVRWAWLVKKLGDVSFRRLIALVLAGAALSNTIPGRPGEFLRGYGIARAARVGMPAGVGSVVADRAFDVLVLVVALVAVLPLVPEADWLDALAFGSLGLAVPIALVLVAARWRFHGRGKARRPANVGSRSMVREAASSFVRGLATVRSVHDVAVLVAYSLAAWSCWAAGAWCCAQALGISLSPAALVFLTVVVNLGVAIPSSPGFVGTYQWLAVSALGIFSVGKSSAFALAVLLHAVSFVPVTAVGYSVLAWLALGRQRRSARAARASA